jgi:hypothetical protein
MFLCSSARTWHSAAGGACAASRRKRSIELTALIKRAATPEQVAQVHQQYEHLFDDINLSAAWFQVHRTTASWSIDRKLRLIGGGGLADNSEGAQLRSKLQRTDSVAAPLAAHVQRRLPHFEPRALSHAAYVAAKLVAHELLEASIQPLVRSVRACSPRLLANALWAFSSQQVDAPQLFASAREALVETDALEQFNPHDLASTAWSFARAGEHDSRLFAALAFRARLSLASFSPNEMAVLAGALAEAGAQEPALFASVARRAESQLEALEPSSLAKLAWALAKSRTIAPGFFDRLLTRSPPAGLLQASSDRELCQLIWALNAARYLHRLPSTSRSDVAASHEHSPGPGQRALVAGVFGRRSRGDAGGDSERGGTVDGQEVVGASSSAAHSRLSPSEREDALSHVLDVTIGRLPRLEMHEAVFLAWAFAPSHLPGVPRLLAAVRALVEPQVGALTPQGISMLAWAHGAAYVPAPALLASLARMAATRVDEMQPQGLVTLLWSCLLLGADSSALMAKVVLMGADDLASFPPKALTMLGWLLCADRTYPPALLRALIARINALPLAGFSHHSRMQLLQLQTALELDAPHLDLSIQPRLITQPVERVDLLQHSSASHRLVSRALSQIGVAHSNEHQVVGLAYTVDIALHATNHVLQVNGPMHYLPLSETPGPKMRLQRRHIEKAGWRVVDVPYWEIDSQLTADDLAGCSSKRLKGYLRQLLAAQGASRPSHGLPPAGAPRAGRPGVAVAELSGV